MEQNFTLDTDRISDAAARYVSNACLKSGQWCDRLLKAVAKSLTATVLGEDDSWTQMREYRADALQKGRERVDDAVDCEVAEARKRASELAQKKIKRELEGWGTTLIGTDDWLERETRKAIREQVRQAFGRRAHQIARDAINANEDALKAASASGNLEDFKREVYRTIGQRAVEAADAVGGEE
jgi:hypothetical protein